MLETAWLEAAPVLGVGDVSQGSTGLGQHQVCISCSITCGHYRIFCWCTRRKAAVSFRHQHLARSAAYSLNHKRRPNLEMVWRKGAIEWRALCRIPKGAELGFDYGDVQGCGFR